MPTRIRNRPLRVGAGVASAVVLLLSLFAAPAEAAIGTASGVVSAPDGSPLSGVTVEARQFFYGVLIDSTATAGDGTYSFAALPAGTYRFVFVHPTLGTLFSGNSPTWTGAEYVFIADGSPAVVDVQYPSPDSVTGVVTGPGAVPLTGMTVELLEPDGWAVQTTTTAGDGSFGFSGLIGGPFTISFSDPIEVHGTQYNGPSNTRTSAPRIHVTGGVTHVVDLQMPIAGRLAGRAMVGTNPPIGALAAYPSPEGLYAFVFDALTSEAIALGVTGPDGTFEVGGLPPGSVKVAYAHPASFGETPEDGYRPVFVPDQDFLSQPNFGAAVNATAYQIAPGSTTTTPDQAMVGHHCDPTVLVPGADLSNGDFAGQNLVGCDLNGAVFARILPDGTPQAADLLETDLRNANLRGAVLVAAPDSIFCWFTECVDPGPIVHVAVARVVELGVEQGHWIAGADLRDAVVDSGAQMQFLMFSQSPYPPVGGYDLLGATEPHFAESCSILGCTYCTYCTYWTSWMPLFSNGFEDMFGGSLSPIQLDGNTTATFARLPDGSRIGDTAGADMRGFRCACVFQPGSDLSNSNLTDADLTNANLAQTIALGVDLTGATLTGTRITNARLAGALGLTGTQLRDTIHNWSNTDLSGTGVDLSWTDFAWYILRGTNLSGSDLTAADLTAVRDHDLTGAQLAAATLAFADLNGVLGNPAGGASAAYDATTCPDGSVTDGATQPDCVGHGLSP